MFKNIKKAISGIIISCMLFFGSMHLAQADESHIKYTHYNQAAYCYGTLLSRAFMHEFGHWFVGKKTQKCNGFFYITPFCNGGACLYQNPTKEIAKAVWNNNIHYPIKYVSPSALSLAAGPLFGISFALLAPILNTFYHEYKQNKSILNAVKKTIQQPYFNDKQNPGIVLGAQFSLILDLINLSPFMPESDGNKIAKSFNLRCPVNRLGILATAVTAATLISPLYIKTVQKLFPDEN